MCETAHECVRLLVNVYCLFAAAPEKHAVVEGLYRLFRQIVPPQEAADDRVFEQARHCWAYLFNRALSGMINCSGYLSVGPIEKRFILCDLSVRWKDWLVKPCF